MEIDTGGPSSLGCVEKDIRNYERDMRQELLGHDAENLIEYFAFEKEKNLNFVFDYETDDDNKLVRCFWADCESRRSYAYFGDAVVFDTTYNTNKYSMVFGPFVGVNHHGQTIIFGCGLLSNETTESFVWLFTKFIEAMPNHTAPGVIITDQDAAIARAISIVLTSTLHRFCLWHILNKFSEKMNVVLYNDQYHRIVGIIKQSESPTEFEQRWTEVMETTELGNNEWLTSMYEIRSRWVPAYVKHVFAAGMVSSRRSESGHSFLKTYVDKKNSLTDFVSRFNRALVHQRHTELAANHIDISQKPKVKSTFMMENQMVQVYTKKIFLLFQKEIEQNNFYMCSKRSSSDKAKVYAIQRLEPNRTFDRHRQVTYFPSTDYISCSCQMFEFEGYPCRHMICYMKKKQVMFLPKKYILRRWTKNAKQATVFDLTAGSYVDDGPGQSLMSRHGILSHAASVLVDDAVLTDVRSTFLLNEFQSLRIRLKEIDNSGDVGMSRNRTQSREETQEIYDPNPVRAKGSGKRLKGGKEKTLSQSNNRQCSACHTSGHDKRTCPMVQNRLVNVDCHASDSQYSYYAPEDGYTITGSSNFEAAPGFFHNHYQFP